MWNKEYEECKRGASNGEEFRPEHKWWGKEYNSGLRSEEE